MATLVALLTLPVAAEQSRRVAPPDRIECIRDQLTAYTGRVQSMKLERDRTSIEIRTDWETTERVAVNHPGKNDPTPWFLVRAVPFREEDWKRIESAPNRLRPATRATAWVCADGKNPVIDWDPAAEPPPPGR